jgi:signal transduction histidine kinase
MDGASRRLVEVVGAVLDHVRIGRSGPLQSELVDLRALAEDVAAELREEAEAKGLAFALEAPPGPPRRSDPRLLRLILRHLLGNAVKFTDRGGVRLRVDAQAGAIEVADTGPGIAPAERELIFTPFREGDDVAHKHREGLGLGLAVVRQAAEALGATLDLRSEPGRGTTFVVTLLNEEP